jgi:hypothetical protein
MGVIPEKANVPASGVPANIKLVLEGKSKVGKTTFAASFPDALMIECEPGGAAHVGCHVFDISVGKDPLKGLTLAIEELRTDTKFRTVILDTVDAVAELTAAAICRELEIGSIQDAPKKKRDGIQWDMYSTRIVGYVGAILALPKNVVILGHTKPATYDKDGVLKKEEGLDIYGKAARILYARVDNIGHLYSVNEGGVTKTMLSFRGGMDCTRGSRHPLLRDKEIIVPQVNGYSAFESLFKEKK